MPLSVMLLTVTGEPQAAEPSQAENGHAQPQALSPAAKPDPLVSLKELVRLLTALSVSEIQGPPVTASNVHSRLAGLGCAGDLERGRGKARPHGILLSFIGTLKIFMCALHHMCDIADS